MPLPDPVPGLVLRYGYLWFDQHRRGQEEGSKDRPCVVVLAVQQDDGDTVVMVVPITHSPPRSPAKRSKSRKVRDKARTRRRAMLDRRYGSQPIPVAGP